MRLPRQLSISITVSAVFFLTFLGMRLPSLDQPLKPKPRPRAVLKFAGKQVTTCSVRFNSPDQSHDIDPAGSCLKFSSATTGRLDVPDLATASAASILRNPNGRSPPRS